MSFRDSEKVKGQIRAILEAAEELSQLILGRSVPVAFDTRPGAPLGYVPVSKEVRGGRTVYLSTQILKDQPEHLLDYYRALLVHELGHLLLHLKESNKEYRRLRRLLRDRFSLSRDFFTVFNTLLDEQLERVLRDTRPEWQRWFNRLEFYTRQLPWCDLEKYLVRNGRTEPEGIVRDLARRGLLKLYADRYPRFAVIQSAAIFSEGLGFSRLFAFFSVLRHRLPLASVREDWLTECLALIPKNFKTLDVFEVHALAVSIFKILMRGVPGIEFLTIEIERDGDPDTAAMVVPVTALPDDKSDKSDSDWLPVFSLRRKRKQRRREREAGPDDDGLAPDPGTVNAPDPEGGPPAPSPPPPPNPRPQKRPPRTPEPVIPCGGATAPLPPRKIPSWAILFKPGDGKGSGRGSRKGKGKLSAKDLLRAKQRSGRLSAKEKTRLRRAARAEKPKPQPPATPPRPTPKARPKAGDAAPPSAGSARAFHFPWSSRSETNEQLKEVNQLLEEVRREMAGKPPEVPAIDRIAPDAGQPSDHRNESDERAFPGADQILRLRADYRKTQELARAVRPFVGVLRPYLAVLNEERILHERLAGGRRLLGSGLKNLLAYGEHRIFADHRLAEAEQHREVFVGILIDTSASMKKDGRLERARRVAALLAECLRDCPEVETAFLGYNHNVYLCGNHEEHALGSLGPAGKTNEAAALDYLRKQHLETPRRRKVVLVLSDGLPTACSVEAVRCLVHSLEKDLGVRFLYGALSAAEHPAYRRLVAFPGEINFGTVRDFGRAVAALFR